MSAIANRAALAAVMAGAVSASPAFAYVTIYTDASAWQAAVTGVTFEESFDDATLECGLSVMSDVGVINSGRFNDRVTRSGGESTTFHWNLPVDAIGGIWDLSPGGPGQGLALTAEVHSGGTVSLYEIPNTTQGGFVGFVSDMPIDDLVIRAGTQSGVAETYNLDGLRWAEAAKTVSVGDCDTGIENRMSGSCSLNQVINTASLGCEYSVSNHGEYVSCIANATKALMSASSITGAEKGRITSCAARSDTGKPD